MRKGKGRMKYGNNDVYDGDWDENLSSGFG